MSSISIIERLKGIEKAIKSTLNLIEGKPRSWLIIDINMIETLIKDLEKEQQKLEKEKIEKMIKGNSISEKLEI